MRFLQIPEKSVHADACAGGILRASEVHLGFEWRGPLAWEEADEDGKGYFVMKHSATQIIAVVSGRYCVML
jgi:hypothetical protein